MNQEISPNKALRASRIGTFAALYAITSLVPISMFIGAPSFLALNLIITPAIALLLPPLEAFFASLFGGVIALYISSSQAIFGPYTILLPVAGATFGSLTCYKAKIGALITSTFLIITITAYLVKNYPFPYFVIPHLVAVAFALISTFRKTIPRCVRIPLYTYISTMAEQGMMMVFAVHLIGLPWELFIGILPLMIYERITATVGASLVVITLKNCFLNILHQRLLVPPKDK